jgi:hypothetical protein
MMRLCSAVLLAAALAALPAGGQESPGARKPLTAQQFDALTRGRVMDTWSGDQVYGVEKFLPGQRSLWQDDRGCMEGVWEQVGEMICFTYEDDPSTPDCWTYFDEGGSLSALFNGDPGNTPIRLTPSARPMTCGDYFGV